MKEKKGLSRYRKQIVFLMDLFIVNFVYFVMIYWVPIRNGTLITEIFTWIPNLTLMIVCLCGFLWASKSYGEPSAFSDWSMSFSGRITASVFPKASSKPF